MIKIGLVGEAPNDTDSIQNLLSKKYSYEDYEYFPLLDRINGSQLDSKKTKRFLQIEYENKKPDIIIFIRDLDSINKKSEEFRNKKSYFSDSNRVVNKKGVFLLNIFEIEAMIIADIDKFNELYKTNIASVDDCMAIFEPKEFLRAKCKEYNESQNPIIFDTLSFETVYNNCNYFKGFISRLDKILK